MIRKNIVASVSVIVACSTGHLAQKGHLPQRTGMKPVHDKLLTDYMTTAITRSWLTESMAWTGLLTHQEA